MTLQRRLALTLALSAVPLVVGLAWVRTEVGRRADVQALRDNVLTRAEMIGRDECEAAPERFMDAPRGGRRGGGPPPDFRGFDPDDPNRPEGGPPGPGRRGFGGRAPFPPPDEMGDRPGRPRGRPGFRPIQFFVYDAQFQPVSRFAPPFPEDLRASLADGSESANHRIQVRPGVEPMEAIELALKTGWSPGPCAFILARRMAMPAPEASWDLVMSAVPLLIGLIAAVWLASGPLVRRVHALTVGVGRSAASRYEVPVVESGNDEITNLARAFNEAGTQVREHLGTLERRDRTLREFLANTTHDVMIPLTVLQGHLSTLQDRIDKAQPLDRAALVGALQEAQYMSSILHNLGAAAKLEAPEQLVQRHPVDLNALVERVVERHKPVARPAGVDIEYAVPEQPIVIDGDVTLLEQAVSNVVHNAVRYNRPGGHVAVVLDAAGRRPGEFRLRILDDGPGVADETLARLTERRYRDDSARQRDPNGLGLGLSIARQVAERHGLQLTFARSEQGGLQVEFASSTASGQTPS
jgi:signal transduction histidine kinase